MDYQTKLVETREMVADYCRPEKIAVVSEISRAIGKVLIELASESELTTDEIRCITYVTVDCIEMSLTEYERVQGIMDIIRG